MPGITAPSRRPVLRPLAEILPGRTAPVTTQPDPPPPPEPPDPVAHDSVVRMLRCVVEIAAGQRAPRQLAPVLPRPQLDYLVGLRRTGLGPRLHSVRTQQPTPGVLEAVAVVRLRTGAVRAMTARFEYRSGALRCSALHLRLVPDDVRRRQERATSVGAP